MSLTFRTREAPTDINMRVVGLCLHRLEVSTADNVKTSKVHTPGRYAVISYVVSCGASNTSIKSP